MPLSPHWRFKLERWRESVRRFFKPDQQQRRPQICPACGSLVGTTATRCHICGASLRFSTAAVTKTLARWMPTQSPTTYAMLSICCLFYGISLLLTVRMGGGGLGSGGFWDLGGINSNVLIHMGSSLPMPYLLGLRQPWRLVTACFLHGSLIHIGFNMWVLMDIGPIVEELYGSARYLFLYTATGIFGYITSAMWMAIRYGGGGYLPPIPSIGASGALLGLIGLLIAVTSRRSGAAAQMLKTQLIRWVVYIFIIGFIMSGTDNAAHLGGLVSGFVLGRIVADRQPHDMYERKRATLLAWATALVIAISFGFMFAYFYQSNHQPPPPTTGSRVISSITIRRTRS